MLINNIQHQVLDKIRCLDCEFNGILHCNKKTFVSFSYIFNQKLKITNDAILEQIYILNKLYDKLIGENKKQIDIDIENFVKIYPHNKKRNDFYRILLNDDYKKLKNNIEIFSNLEKIVRQNLTKYNIALNKYKNYLCDNINHFDLNNIIIANITTGAKPIEEPIPSVKYCQDDINKKLKYINNLYNITTKQNPKDLKGDTYYGI